jgi:hypothetical protein
MEIEKSYRSEIAQKSKENLEMRQENSLLSRNLTEAKNETLKIESNH